jgi:alkylated DNA repair dioxygenase AlkB
LKKTDPIPSFLHPSRQKAAAVTGVPPDILAQVLLTEYQPGATIGWHNDRSVFDIVVGLSLV